MATVMRVTRDGRGRDVVIGGRGGDGRGDRPEGTGWEGTAAEGGDGDKGGEFRSEKLIKYVKRKWGLGVEEGDF